VTVTIYVEGGGNNNAETVRCKRGFTEYCKKLAPVGRLPRIVACGGRDQAFDRFATDVARNKPDNLCVLLVDSEGPVEPGTSPAVYLHARDRWVLPQMQLHRLFLMVQAMEAWLLADRDRLAEYYGPNFRPNALRGDERHVEAIAKDDLEPCLIAASRDTTTKGRYNKGTHAFDLLATIDPAKVAASSPHAAEFHAFLRSL